MLQSHKRGLTKLDFILGKHIKLETLAEEKNGKMWEFFPSRGPPPPLFGNDTFVKKNYGLFCISGP